MKKSAFLLLILLVNSAFAFSQIKKDSLEVNYIYPPNPPNPPNLYDGFTPKESWDIHKAAYIKQLKAKGVTEEEFKKSLIDYENQKEEFLARVKEQQRIAELQRKKDAEQREKDAIQREKDAIQREKDATERAKADEQREKSQEWRKNAEDILIKNIALSNQSSGSQPITFNVTSKTTLYVGIRAHINSGSTLIEIYNPKGVKEGELSLKFKSKSDSNKEENTSGALDKTIANAEVGEWQIKISSQKADGSVAMSVAQYIKPTMDE